MKSERIVSICSKDTQLSFSAVGWGCLKYDASPPGRVARVREVIPIWDFETIDTADTVDDTGLLEIEPINELQVDKNVKLFSLIKINAPGYNLWLAQDANGAIWKLDLSFSNITQDPECLFSFHSEAIEAMATSPLTYLMATTALDCSVRIYDFASKNPLTQMKFKQGGTALTWVPRIVSYSGAQIAVGFEDGVVRILELYDPKGLTIFAGRKKVPDVDIFLKHVFKPHTAQVTALAYERDAEVLATGSKDQTVFFFEVEKNYKPIGYINTPGPVCQLIWSSILHPDSTLLIFCENGYVLEAPCPTIKEEEEDRDVVSYEIHDMCLKCFHFTSVKSKILRLIEIEKREKQKELKAKEREERIKKLIEEMGEDAEKEFQEEEEEEEEEPLPEIFIPPNPSPILCGFYSGPGKFWVSLFGIETQPPTEDIEDPKAYSIENARKKREHDKLMKEMEELKAGKREQIQALRNTFWKLIEMNKELPEHMQFKRTVSLSKILITCNF
uniref:Cilia- and flagella-associated protein 43 n=1 Tax=Urocitellus parryii TaxID=9999 RepID=A0A8D2IF14_UROPR